MPELLIEEMYIEYDVKQDGLYLRGYEEGEKKSLKKVAIRCLKQGKTYEETAELTGLDIESIAKIDKERKKK